jgi:hypothetical protein
MKAPPAVKIADSIKKRRKRSIDESIFMPKQSIIIPKRTQKTTSSPKTTSRIMHFLAKKANNRIPLKKQSLKTNPPPRLKNLNSIKIHRR